MALPDSQIYYPGSTVLSRSATDGSNNVNGEAEDAYVRTWLNAPATQDKIVSWYRKTLGDAGWRNIEANVQDSGHYAFNPPHPGPSAGELIYLDFRFPAPPTPPTVPTLPTGTAYMLTFGIATP